MKSLTIAMFLSFCLSLAALADSQFKALFQQGETFYIQTKGEKALPFYRQALALNRDSLICQIRIAQCYHMIQEDEEALPFINKVLTKIPDDVSANYVKMTILNALGKYEEALIVGRKIMKTPGTFVDINVEIARSMLNCHKYEEAQKYVTDQLKISPGHGALLQVRIKAGIVLGNWEQVASDCTVAIKALKPLSPTLVRVLTDRADAYKHLKKYDLAIKDYQGILAVVHDYRPAHVGLKDIYKLMGNKKMFDKEMKFLESLDQDSEPPI